MHFLMKNSYPSQTTHTKLPSLRTTTRLGGLQGSLQGEPTGGAYRGSLQGEPTVGLQGPQGSLRSKICIGHTDIQTHTFCIPKCVDKIFFYIQVYTFSLLHFVHLYTSLIHSLCLWRIKVNGPLIRQIASWKCEQRFLLQILVHFMFYNTN